MGAQYDPATMSATDDLLTRNDDYAERFDRAGLEAAPSRRVAIVTCMDARINVAEALGLGPGEAHVLRNAGGVVTDDVIRSLALSQRKLGTREVVLVHHTECGLGAVSDDGFRAELQEETGMAPPFAIESFEDVEASVRGSIARVKGSPFLPHRGAVRGFVYDVDSGRLSEVEPL